jgi:hypothetical protein
MQKPFSNEKKNIIFSFYLCEERICRVDFPHAFQDSFLISANSMAPVWHGL